MSWHFINNYTSVIMSPVVIRFYKQSYISVIVMKVYVHVYECRDGMTLHFAKCVRFGLIMLEMCHDSLCPAIQQRHYVMCQFGLSAF